MYLASTFPPPRENPVTVNSPLSVKAVTSAMLELLSEEYFRSSSAEPLIKPLNDALSPAISIGFFSRKSGSPNSITRSSSGLNPHSPPAIAEGVLWPTPVSLNEPISFTETASILPKTPPFFIAARMLLDICPILHAPAVCELDGPTIEGPMMSKIDMNLRSASR